MRNLETLYSKAVTVEIENGLTWYNDANATLKALAEKYHVEPILVYAVCSALSPRCTWQINIADTETVLSWHGKLKSSRVNSYPKVTTYNQNRNKAINILNTGNPHVFTACKTLSFFHNLYNPDSSEHVTIDGHAINAYYGKLGKVKNKYFTPKHYSRIAKAYIKGAKLHGILPNQYQAIIWVVFKRIHNIRVNWRDYQCTLPF
jgi:hypothetical protein